MIDGIERVGVYGGTFAPIHNGHVAAAKAFFEQMKLDKLLIIPAFLPPHKIIDASDNPVHRLHMCHLAFENEIGFEISDLEIKRGGRSYTVDTLRTLSAPGRKLFLLCGTDMMLTFDEWKSFEEIFNLCCPVYIRRENDTSLDEKIIAKNNEYYQKYGVAFRRIVTDPITLSSTEIRDFVKKGMDISAFVPEKVQNYIHAMRLYES